MDAQFIMGQADCLKREESGRARLTQLNPELQRRLIAAAMQESLAFYSEFLKIPFPQSGKDTLVDAYLSELEDAKQIGLYQGGGIREKDHLNFWCLGRVLAPECYIESGVFKGSSLHAYLTVEALRRVVAIDPDLRNLKVPHERIPGAELISEQDFSEVALGELPKRTLAYFDDHIDTAARILQAAAKGVKVLVFDDSTGLQGVCQRQYPAVPTLPMIMNVDSLRAGDTVSWTLPVAPIPNLLFRTLQSVYWKFRNRGYIRTTMTLTAPMLAQCRKANELVDSWSSIPDLGQYLPLSRTGNTMDTTKYIIRLKD